jgi:hypothetical protein
MKKQLAITFNLLITTLFFLSCQNEKSNKTLNKLEPNSYLYRKEVAKIINDSTSNTTYIFEKYSYKNNTEYLKVKVETQHSEVFIDIKVLEWDSILSKIKEFKGKGYGGSELKNLKLKVLDDGKQVEYIYISVDEIID